MSEAFEWWYLQVVSPRLLLTITVHRTDIAGGSTPYLSVSALAPADGRAGSWRIPLAAPQRGRALWADGMVVERREGYAVSVDADGLRLRLVVVPGSDPWGPAGCCLYEDPQSGKSANWCVIMPFGTASGDISWDGRRTAVAASAYLDHNWGALPLHDALASWTWLAVARRDGTTVGAAVVPRCGEPFQLTNAPRGRLADDLLAQGLLQVDGRVGDRLLEKAALMLGWIPNHERFRIVKRQRYQHGCSTALTYVRWAITADPRSTAGTGVLGGFMETALVSRPSRVRLERSAQRHPSWDARP